MANATHLVHVELPVGTDAATAFRLLYRRSPRVVWLDSGAPSPELSARARWSIIADDRGPFAGRIRWANGRGAHSGTRAHRRLFGGLRGADSFFSLLDSVWDRGPHLAPLAGHGPFALGWLGYLGYELKEETEGTRRHPSAYPDAQLLFADRAIVVDLAEGRSWAIALQVADERRGNAANRRWLERVSNRLRRATELSGSPDGGRAPSRRVPRDAEGVVDTAASYREKVAAAREQIRLGNAYQVCLTTQFDVPGRWRSPAAEYARIRAERPAPFGSFLRFGGVSAASISPERFLSIDEQRVIRVEPIKGTGARRDALAPDPQGRQRLRESEKDTAENLMIVDLARNDVLKVSDPHSLVVTRLFDVESHPTVHQLVSTVQARLRDDATGAAAVAACFPPASMTGAPKASAMGIIDALEAGPRGIYSGAIGFFSLSGTCDLAVAIRTLVTHRRWWGGTRRRLGAGGAVTWYSTPSDEVAEVEAKTVGVLGPLRTRVRW